jgi:hypothetical protein
MAFPWLTACAPDAPKGVEESHVPVAHATSAPDDMSHRARPGYVIDSVLPVGEELRRFRTGLGPAPAAVANGAPSRDALVRRFFASVADADTATLRRMTISRAEFAHLVYPSSPYTHAPYRQSPELVWMQLQANGSSGLARILERARGYTYLSHRCAAPVREGMNVLWRQCRARVVRAPGDTAEVRLFGVVVERDRRFKLASFETDF